MFSFGEGEDFELSEPNAVSRLGVSLRLAQDGDRIAASPSTPFVEEWVAGPEETLADDESLSSVADALDDADVVAAVVTRVEGGLDQLGRRPLSEEQIEAIIKLAEDEVPAAPFDAVGLGWSVEDGEAMITVAYHFASGDEAADAVGALENLFRDGLSFVTDQPISDRLTLQDVTADADVVSVSLTLPEDSQPQIIYAMLQRQDLPFVSR